ncbi:MAG: hypothetical protein HY964_00740 [Ignavibacteriales bacterium]|nr:hypothetical protein [Ignavibacteriales bacterium]
MANPFASAEEGNLQLVILQVEGYLQPWGGCSMWLCHDPCFVQALQVQ